MFEQKEPEFGAGTIINSNLYLAINIWSKFLHNQMLIYTIEL